MPQVALRKESVDRNAVIVGQHQAHAQSLSARRAWIEIFHLPLKHSNTKVALRKESVDRNFIKEKTQRADIVALRKESVDRNHSEAGKSQSSGASLSARRAWIEIGAS